MSYIELFNILTYIIFCEDFGIIPLLPPALS